MTIDIHTHLLNPEVRFNRLYDRVAITFFARGLGVDPKALLAAPYVTYVRTFASLIRESANVDKACVFGVDARIDEQGREVHRDVTVCSDNAETLRVAREHPDCFIPFFSVNPRRKDALERVDRHVAEGFRGAKFLQNYWGLDAGDERLIPYYERLRDHGLPLIIHTGSEYSIQSTAAYEAVRMVELPMKVGVTVIAAHMGLGRWQRGWRVWRNFSRDPATFGEDYYQLLEWLESWPNLYADISAILPPMRARALRHLSQHTQVHHKLLFGTDYPVPFSLRFNTHDLPADRCRAHGCIANPFDRYMAIVKEYFPDGHPLWSNYRKVLS